MTVGQRIQEIRKARGYSQDAVAHDLGISTTAYAKIERSESDVNISRLNQIAKVLQVETWAFFSPQNAINIIGDINNGGNTGGHNIYFDFKDEREAYKKHIENLEKQIQMMKDMLDNALGK